MELFNKLKNNIQTAIGDTKNQDIEVVFNRLKREATAINKKYTVICKDKTLKRLAELIHDDENIKAMIPGFFDGISWSGIATNKRVFFLSNMGFKKFNIELPMDRITSLSHSKSLVFGEIIIYDGLNKIIVYQVPNRFIMPFINEVNQQIHNRQTIKIEKKIVTEENVTSQIEKLSDLHKAGVLTDYEFSIKKQELLNKKG